VDPFTWKDGERLVAFGRGRVADVPQLAGDRFVLVTTDRALQQAPELGEAAAHVLRAGSGYVEDVAAALLPDLPDGDGMLVALGGGRVIDATKALAAATGRRAGAVPTTLSSAEMTWVHRHAKGVDEATPRTRPRMVVNDPALSASQPLDQLAASAANALAHAVEGPCTTLASPVPTLAAQEAIRLTAEAYVGRDEPDRDALALASLLAGWTIDASWYGLSHVCSQTLVRVGPAPHGPANAAVLPHTAAALRRRRPEVLAAADAAAGCPVEELAHHLARHADADGIRKLGVPRDRLDVCAEVAAGRGELDLTPPRATQQELLEIFRAAW
jgi:alcohol dehydrogenase class IV